MSKRARLSNFSRLGNALQVVHHISSHLFVLNEFSLPIFQALEQCRILDIGNLMRMIVAQSSLGNWRILLELCTCVLGPCFARRPFHKASILLRCTSIRAELLDTLWNWYQSLSWLSGLLIIISVLFNFKTQWRLSSIFIAKKVFQIRVLSGAELPLSYISLFLTLFLSWIPYASSCYRCFLGIFIFIFYLRLDKWLSYTINWLGRIFTGYSLKTADRVLIRILRRDLHLLWRKLVFDVIELISQLFNSFLFCFELVYTDLIDHPFDI